MAFDFPAAPTEGQSFTPPGGPTYVYHAPAWQLAGEMPLAEAAVGQVAWFARNTTPTGFLKCNGAAVSRTSYAGLFTAIGTAFGAGDGSTTFNVPDLRGEFVRGWDDSRGVDAGRSFASAQAGALESHSHGATADTDGNHYHQISTNQPYSSGSPTISNTGLTSGGLQSSTGAKVSFNAGLHEHVITVSPAGATETRPRNVALLPCIRY